MHKVVLVLGLGKTGFSIARYLTHLGTAFIAYDTRLNPPDLEKFKQEFPGVEVFCQDFPNNRWESVKKIISSPGISPQEPILKEAINQKISIESELDCLADAIDKPVIAITGSNGKSTVTTLVGEIAKQAGLNVAIGGNLGTPVLDLLLDSNHYDLWVLELSSFQLTFMHRLKITAATILNISPDHLDWHGSMENYIDAKHQIFANTQYLVFNREDVATSPRIKSRIQESFGLNRPDQANEWGVVPTPEGNILALGEELWISVHAIKLQGKHNWMNIMASIALARAVGISKAVIVEILKRFTGLAHRTQWVGIINGVPFINDSKGTNLGATQAAIEGIGPTISGKLILIAGGLGKGADFTSLREPLKQFVKKVILIGKDADILAHDWNGATELVKVGSLKDAVHEAHVSASQGDLVLLSPACASFDMFKGYEHRGDEFVKYVRELMT